jgi:hypothetical protein
MANLWQDPWIWSTAEGCTPPDEIRPGPEQDNDLTIV